MHGFPGLPAADMRVWGCGLILDTLTQRLGVFMLRRGGVERIGHAILLGFAEVIDQQVPCNGRNPRRERALRGVITGERPIHLDEDLLGEVLSVVARPGKAIADVEDAAVIGANDFLPGGGVAGNSAANKHRDNLDVFQPALPGTAVWNLRAWDRLSTKTYPSLSLTRQYEN